MNNDATTDKKNKTQLYFNILISNIHKLQAGMSFKSYRRFCEFIGIEPTGGRTKKAIIAELKKHCEINEGPQSISIVSIKPKPDDLQLQTIDKKYLKSKIYPACTYLLLTHLIDKCLYVYEDSYCNSKRYFMGIMFMCNSKYRYARTESIDITSTKSSECEAFFHIARTHLTKIVDRTLEWAKERGLLDYNVVYIIRTFGNHQREATTDETIAIKEYWKVIEEKYGVTESKYKFSRHKTEIERDFKEHLGHMHFKGMKFYLTHELESNAEYLKRSAELAEDCGYEINKLIYNNIYNTVLKFIVKNREIEMSLHKVTFVDFDEFIEDFVKNGAPIGKDGKDKFHKTWGFHSDDAVIENAVAKLTDCFIKVGNEL